MPLHTPRQITKAVIPAAGLGTRFLPATKAVPKELLPLVDKPILQYVVEEAVASGIEKVVIVTSDAKPALQAHFSPNWLLEEALESKGQSGEAEQLRKLSQLADIQWVCQPSPLGLGHAVTCAEDAVGDEPFGLLLADNIVDSEVPCLRQLMNYYARNPGCIVAAREVQPELASSSGMLWAETVPARPGFRVTRLVEKPGPNQAHSGFGIFGRYVLEPEVFAALRRLQRNSTTELQLTDALELCCRAGHPVYGYAFDGTPFDTGDKFGFVQATIAYSLKHAAVGRPIREYLASLDLQPAAAARRA